MGHLVGKDVFRALGAKFDSMEVRVPWTESFHEILTALYSREEADLAVRLPLGLSTLDQLVTITGYDEVRLRRLLDRMCAKGLVVDLQDEAGVYRYMPSVLMAGVFEFTMMRTDPEVDTAKMARLFHEYLLGDPAFLQANTAGGLTVTPLRVLPHVETIDPQSTLEVLDYERAAELVDGYDRFSLGLCACRHGTLHRGTKTCDIDLETCSSFGVVADYLIRNGLAREASKQEMLDRLARSREERLVFTADSVQRNITFICHCCADCCHPLIAIRETGFPDLVLTSRYLAVPEPAPCKGCGKCVRACPIEAIHLAPNPEPGGRPKKRPVVDRELCIGCGVCALECKTGAMRLTRREREVIYPETTFRRIMLQALERGNLQNFIFENPNAGSHRFLRAVTGAFLKLPAVKRALMSDQLRSRFLGALEAGARLKGQAFTTEL